MRRANTTFVNLRAAARRPAPARRGVQAGDAEAAPRSSPSCGRSPATRARRCATCRSLVRAPGADNDLVELTRGQVAAARHRRRRRCSATARSAAGAFPESVDALRKSIPELAYARPYAVDLTGWFDDFGHSGIYDALGGKSRVGTYVNAFAAGRRRRCKPIPVPLRDEVARAVIATGQRNRCPGAAEHPAPDKSNPWKPTPDYNCDPSQVLPGRMRRVLRHRSSSCSPSARSSCWARPRRRRRRRRRGQRFKVELDNAFGLIEGGDFKIAGVRAGKITTLELDQQAPSARSSGSRSPRTASARCARTCAASRARSRSSASTSSTASPARRPRSSSPARRSRSSAPSDRPARPRQQHHAPPVPRAPELHPRRARRRPWPATPTTSTTRCAAPSRRCARPTRCSRSSRDQNQILADLTRDADRVVGDLADNRRDVAPLGRPRRATPPRASAERDDEHRRAASSACRRSCASCARR